VKKYILSVIAIIMVVAGSAFVNKMNSTDTQYYWYKVNSSGQIVEGSEAYDGDQVDMQFAEDNLPCTPGNASDCVRGFNSQLTQFPTSAPGIVSLKKN
jgi:hypothetical protein